MIFDRSNTSSYLRSSKRDTLGSMMQTTAGTESFHVILEIGTPILLALLSWIGIRIDSGLKDIRIEQAQAKEDLVENQNQIKEDLNKKHQENTQNIAVHTAEDNQRFDGISRTLQRIDRKLDDIGQRGTR